MSAQQAAASMNSSYYGGLGPAIVGVVWPLLCIATILVVLRIYTYSAIVKNRGGWSLIWACVAWVRSSRFITMRKIKTAHAFVGSRCAQRHSLHLGCPRWPWKPHRNCRHGPAFDGCPSVRVDRRVHHIILRWICKTRGNVLHFGRPATGIQIWTVGLIYCSRNQCAPRESARK